MKKMVLIRVVYNNFTHTVHHIRFCESFNKVITTGLVIDRTIHCVLVS